ncbi:hypothetical protein [Rhodococcus zopfii]|uniref:hypothetical protein n=1 Tax=Rhodococcus zopfii TaxID=43772 RepID=UPI0009347A30|nr:hypothetical protein [Rhodococcus zopfii]
MTVPWEITAVSSLPEPRSIDIWERDRRERYESPALLLQKNRDTGATRVVFGVVDPQRGEIKPLDPDREDPGRIGDVDYVHPKND